MVKKYISRGTNINVKDDKGWFPLLVAVDTNNYDMVKLLIYLSQ